MKKVIIMFISLFILTGCSSTVNVNIEKDKVTENIVLNTSKPNEYNEIKNWIGFPLPLYYDQELEDPFSDNQEKESGVPYYDVNFDDSIYRTDVSASFDLNKHERSSVVRNCFAYYNVVESTDKVIFSTSKGLTCSFTEFILNVKTPYKILSHNADSYDEKSNTLTWNSSEAKADDVSIYIEIDFSSLKDGSSSNASNDIVDDSNNVDVESSSNMFVWIIIGIIFVLFAIVGAFVLKIKKDKNSSI